MEHLCSFSKVQILKNAKNHVLAVLERGPSDNILLSQCKFRYKNPTSQRKPVEALNAKQLFEILVRENSRMLLAYIRSIQSDQVAADDIWQETMLVAWRRLDDYDTSRPFGPWLRGIAQKIVLANFSRSKGKVTVADTESLEYLSQRFESVQSLKGDTLDEKLEALRDCIAGLSEQDRQCVVLRYQQCLMPAELSDRMGIALEAVKKRLLRAKQRLVQCITSKIEVAHTREAAL